MPICHFSGNPGPDALVDIHTDLTEPAEDWIRDYFKEMKIVCLEMPWHKMTLEEAEAIIQRFRKNYLDPV